MFAEGQIIWLPHLLYITNKLQEVRLEKLTAMKTLRLFGLTLMAILLSVNFTSCSEDDDPTKNIEELEGTWVSVKYEGQDTDKESGETYNDEISFDIDDTDGDMERRVFTKTGENTYSCEYLYYYDSTNNWESEGTDIFELNGTTLTNKSMEDDIYEIESLTSNKLVLYQSWDDEDYKGFVRITYQKLN